MAENIDVLLDQVTDPSNASKVLLDLNQYPNALYPIQKSDLPSSQLTWIWGDATHLSVVKYSAQYHAYVDRLPGQKGLENDMKRFYRDLFYWDGRMSYLMRLRKLQLIKREQAKRFKFEAWTRPDPKPPKWDEPDYGAWFGSADNDGAGAEYDPGRVVKPT